MTARQRLEQLGVPADALDAYELDVRRDVAAQLYDLDSGTCGCGCHCAVFVDPDEPCPWCDGKGGSQLGQACYLCGLERTTPPEPRKPGPTLIPSVLYGAMIQHLLGTKPVLSRPTYSGVLQYLEGSDP